MGEPVWTQKTLRHALAARGLRPRKGFGQHFLVDPNGCRAIVHAADLPPGADVLEIGAGPGLLTVHLARVACRVTAVEIDPDMAVLCREALAGAPNVAVIESSILDDRARIAPAVPLALSHPPTLSPSHSPTLPLHVFGNLPYNLSVSILIALLDWDRPVTQIVALVQREVGERLRARPGEEPYGPLSAVARAFSDVKVLRAIPARVFWPAPRVESSLVQLRPKPNTAGRARPSASSPSGDGRTAPRSSASSTSAPSRQPCLFPCPAAPGGRCSTPARRGGTASANFRAIFGPTGA